MVGCYTILVMKYIGLTALFFLPTIVFGQSFSAPQSQEEQVVATTTISLESSTTTTSTDLTEILNETSSSSVSTEEISEVIEDIIQEVSNSQEGDKRVVKTIELIPGKIVIELSALNQTGVVTKEPENKPQALTQQRTVKSEEKTKKDGSIFDLIYQGFEEFTFKVFGW